MRNRPVLALAAALLCAAPAFAGPPNTRGVLSDKEADRLLLRLVFATVAGRNCAAYETTQAEWRLIVDTSDQLADQLGLSTDDYEERYYDAAFDALRQNPAFCETQGPLIQPLIAELIEAGGSLDESQSGD
jgi:hypothetical protein